MTWIPGTRAFADGLSEVISEDDFAGPWWVDEIMTDGSIRASSPHTRLDTALRHADIIAQTIIGLDRRHAWRNETTSGVQAVTVAGMAYDIPASIQGRLTVRSVPVGTPGQEQRRAAHELAMRYVDRTRG